MARILVVEDDPAIALGLRNDLTFEGYDVEVAEDGETASRRAGETVFDLILLDMMLPRKDGMAVARDIRRRGLKTPIIMLTARAMERDKISGLEAGADDYITKPFSPLELCARIKAVLRRSDDRPDLANQKELDEARRIQRRLMPSDISQIAGFHIAGAWQPACIVGGDYFDVLKFDEETIAVCIADVCGKGMPAALMMANLQAVVKTCAAKHIHPNELCASVNRVMCQNMAGQGFVSFFYGVIDSRAKRLTYCNAGHNPPILARSANQFSRLECGGGILGVFKEWLYEEAEVALAPGDRILIYTDGITESRNSNGEEFGDDRLIDLVRRQSLEAAALADQTIAASTQFCAGNFDDDLTVLAVSVG